MKLMYIDACMHPDSRTQYIAESILTRLAGRYDVEMIMLDKTNYRPIDRDVLYERNNGYVPKDIVLTAKRIAKADRILIAAPFWDMSFPSILKVFFENMSLFHITFDSTDKECVGLCKCKKVMYVTTRGMDISTGSPLDQGTPYIKAISHLWGLGDVTVISAQNLDYSTPEVVRRKIMQAIEKGQAIAEQW